MQSTLQASDYLLATLHIPHILDRFSKAVSVELKYNRSHQLRKLVAKVTSMQGKTITAVEVEETIDKGQIKQLLISFDVSKVV